MDFNYFINHLDTGLKEIEKQSDKFRSSFLRLKRNKKVRKKIQNYINDSKNFLEVLKQRINDGYFAYFEYSAKPMSRYGWGKNSNEFTLNLIEKNISNYEEILKKFNELSQFCNSIDLDENKENLSLPYWRNTYLPFIDALSICGFIKENKPNTFLEIGSGNSTRFASYAAKYFATNTQIISIDKYPGSTIEAIPDSFIKCGLEELRDLTLFSKLKENDIVWLDGSHRSFSSTDVTVFFMDVLPKIPAGVLIGIHDIQLPWDYPIEWTDRFYNEQYLLAAYLVGAGSENAEIILPCFYVNNINHYLRNSLKDIIGLGKFIKNDVPQLKGGGAFWFKKRK